MKYQFLHFDKWKSFLMGILVLFWMFGAVFKLYDIAFGWLDYRILIGISLCGGIAILMNASWKIRLSLYWAIPLLLGCELLSIVLIHTGFEESGMAFRFVGELMYPLAGVLFLFKSILIWADHPSFSLKLFILGVFCISAGIFQSSIPGIFKPFGFSLMQMQDLALRISFLGVLGVLILIDWTERLSEKGFVTEQALVRVALIVVSVKFFKEFIFV